MIFLCICNPQNGFVEHFKGKGAKAFRANYLRLWDRAIKEALERDLLNDDYLLDQVVDLLTGLNMCAAAVPLGLLTCQLAQVLVKDQ